MRSTIDIALWDLASRAAAQPLHVALGGDPRVHVAPLLRIGPLMDDEPAYLEAIDGWVDRGFGAVKLHAWGDPDTRRLPDHAPCGDASPHSR